MNHLSKSPERMSMFLFNTTMCQSFALVLPCRDKWQMVPDYKNIQHRGKCIESNKESIGSNKQRVIYSACGLRCKRARTDW